MSPHPTSHLPSGGSGWASKVFIGLVVVVFAVLAAVQFVSPDKRVIQVVAAGLVILFAFRFRSIEGLMLAVLFLPFPKGTSYGNTNVAFVLLLFIVWIFRVRTRRAPPPSSTPLDLPILGLIMAYCLSFYNVEPENLAVAWSLFLGFLSYLLIYFMVVNTVRTSSDVQKIFLVQTVSCVIVCLFAVYEQRHPGVTIVPGWIELGQTAGGPTGGVRVGSTFLDYELFGEYCALNLILQFFLWTRATSKTRRWIVAGIILLTFFCLFATVTRGAIITFIVGATYLVWLSRKRLNFVRLVGIASLAIGSIFLGDFVVATYTKSESVLQRLTETKIQSGMPDDRAEVWSQSFQNFLDHPIIGHGPYYAARKGVLVQYWPHNVYLFYAHIVGAVGLAFFLWILWELFKISRPRAPSLGSGSFLSGATIAIRVMLVMFMVDQTKIDYLRNARYSFFIWFLFGMIVATARAWEREQADARQLHLVDLGDPDGQPATAVRDRLTPAPPLRVAPRHAAPAQ